MLYLGRIENPLEIRIVSKGPLDARYGGGDFSSGDRKQFDSHVETDVFNNNYNLI